MRIPVMTCLFRYENTCITEITEHKGETAKRTQSYNVAFLCVLSVFLYILSVLCDIRLLISHTYHVLAYMKFTEQS